MAKEDKPEQGKNIRKPQQDRSRDTRRRILDAGRDLFGEKGYRETNAKEIARRAGVATGSFYAYFREKGDVFLEITKDYYREIFGEIQRVSEEMDLNQSIDGIIGSMIETLYLAHDIEPELHREISMMILAGANKTAPDSADQRLYRRVLDEVEKLDRVVEEWLKQLLSKFIPGTGPEEHRVAATLIFRSVEEVIHRLKQFPQSMPEREDVLKELTLMVERYLAGYDLREFNEN